VRLLRCMSGNMYARTVTWLSEQELVTGFLFLVHAVSWCLL
jgi:hypothetical protein